VDVADGDSIVQLAATATKSLGGIDIWINNAGIFPSQPLLEMSDAAWDRVLDVNLRGAFIGAREAARCMIAGGGGGVIVNVASVAGFRGIGPGISHYVASKHGMRGLTSQLAVELAPYAIRVLGVAPTSIKTEGVLSMPAMQSDDMDRRLNTLLGRPGVPDDVARVVLFCVSDLALFMTGSTLIVDAGRLSLG
jgi:NAD(P)-dependent dehydrogenase (short-subunit alcohol dehydrogenase family)